MSRYELPERMRYSTLEEREEFYRKEFDVRKVEEWFGNRLRNTVFAVIIGRHTGIYPSEYEEDASTTILIDKYKNLEEVREQILRFKPESSYYDRNIYCDNGEMIGQEMAFDLDPENLTCPIHGALEDKMKRQQGLGFCSIELDMVKEETAKLYEELQKKFSLLKIVYSGRGFHIHVLDEDVFHWSRKRRKQFASKIKSRGFLIDEWVTSGGMRLIRLPYSLHGMVSRIATPVSISELSRFDAITDKQCIPKFLRFS